MELLEINVDETFTEVIFENATVEDLDTILKSMHGYWGQLERHSYTDPLFGKYTEVEAVEYGNTVAFFEHQTGELTIYSN